MSLRRFIKNCGYMVGGAALLASTPWLQSFTPDKLEEMKGHVARLGIIATGSRGLYHIHNLLTLKHAKIVALCDIYEPNLQKAHELCPDAKLYHDYRKLLEDKEIDGVIISSPLHLHAPMVLDSLAAGKHTFCEKSMALTMEECKAIYEAYKKTDKVLYFGMQRLFEEKYIKALQMIREGVIGEVVGIRSHWFRNHNWRREVPSPELERQINWRLYWEYSAGLMTELATHQLEVANWVMGRMPESVMGMGDIVHWKDGREVYDSISLTYRYANGVKNTYETLIANKHYGMGEEILGTKGTMELAKGIYYLEEPQPSAGIVQMMQHVKSSLTETIPIAGASWRPEVAQEYKPNHVLPGKISVNSGTSMIGVENDGSLELVDAFCQACLTGEKAPNVVEEAYGSTLLCLLGNQAIAEERKIFFPEEYKIDYFKF